MEVKFKNEFELMDYQTDVDWAQKYINDWIAKQTEGHITDLIQGLSPFTKATLVSILSFNIMCNSTKEIINAFHIFY